LYRFRKERLRYVLLLAGAFLAAAFVISNGIEMLYPLKFKEHVFKYSNENNLDPHLVFAIIKAESGFNPSATSNRNARGLMQISEKTAKWGAECMDMDGFSVEKLYDPETNIKIGCWYLNILLKEFGNNIDLVIAAYNGGSGNVNEWLRNRNYSSSGTNLEKIPFKETEMFVKKVKKYFFVYKKLYGKGR